MNLCELQFHIYNIIQQIIHRKIVSSVIGFSSCCGVVIVVEGVGRESTGGEGLNSLVNLVVVVVVEERDLIE